MPGMARMPPPRSVPHPDPSVWPQEQQKQFLDSLMGGGPMQSQGQIPPFMNRNIDDGGDSLPPGSELASILSSFSQFPSAAPDSATKPGLTNPSGKSSAAPTRLQKMMPLIHLVCVWSLLAYFVLWKEPQLLGEKNGVADEDRWLPWAELAWRKASEHSWGAQVVPFFWAFTTLQIVLHSMRIFSGFDDIQPPMLVSLALPHLPPPLPAIIIVGITYLQVGGVLLDDIAGLVVGMGLIVGISSWVVGSRGGM